MLKFYYESDNYSCISYVISNWIHNEIEIFNSKMMVLVEFFRMVSGSNVASNCYDSGHEIWVEREISGLFEKTKLLIRYQTEQEYSKRVEECKYNSSYFIK